MWTGLLFLLLVYIKMFEETKLILASIWKLQWLPSTKDNVSVFIYSFAKNKTMSIPFLYTKRNTLYVKRFSWNFEVGVYIQNHDTFRYMTFFVQKSRHFAKSKTIYIMFYTQKAGHFAFCDFHGIFEIGGVGGHFYMQKPMQFALHLYSKNYVLRVIFLYPKFFVLLWYLTINSGKIRAIRSKNKFELFIENWSYSYNKYITVDTYHRMGV